MPRPWIDDASILEAARSVRLHAYAPYSTHRVGAAVLTSTGEVYPGCNVENASYGLAICAERAAACAAVAAGQTEIVAVAVVAPGAPAPCGACRQFLAEFGPKMQVLIVDAEDPNQHRRTTLDQLLPEPFRIGPA